MSPAVEERTEELRRLCIHYEVRRLDLFGSAATGRDDSEESDLDFLVEFQPAALNAYADATSACWKPSAGCSDDPWTWWWSRLSRIPTSCNRWSRPGLPSMRLEARKYLYDIQRAADLLREFTSDKTFANYEGDAMLRSAVERQLEIIGEAMTSLARIDMPVAGRISHCQRIIALRNVLIHGYADVDDRLVWDVIKTNLPTLEREVEALLREGADD